MGNCILFTEILPIIKYDILYSLNCGPSNIIFNIITTLERKKK